MDRRTFLRFFNLAWLVACASAIKSKAQAMNSKPIIFYVAPDGNDAWSGKLAQPKKTKKDGPFATLTRARDAIRVIKRQQKGTLNQSITIMVRGGTYFLPEPLILTSEDSGTENFPINYQAYPNEKPIISGGKPITNWKKQGDVWVANLPEVKAGKWSFRVLRVNDNWAICARYPKLEPNNPLKGGWLFAPNSSEPELSYKKNNRIIAITPQQFPNWKNWDGAEVNIFLGEGWANGILPVTNVDKQLHKVFVKSSATVSYMNIKPGNRFFIDNVREALTSPGEWYLDKKTGELLYWPIELNFPKNIEVVAPIMDRLIVLQGDRSTDDFVQYINFQGLTFKDSDYTLAINYFAPSDAAIWLSGVQHCLIENCHFTRLAGYAVQLEKGSRNNQIIRNKINQMGQGGVLFRSSGKDENDQPRRNLVAANDIHDSGQIYKHVAGVYLNCGSENYISHNHISRMPRYGISLKTANEKFYSFRNIIEFNKIFDVCLETSDTGAIESYTGHFKSLSRNIIRYNFIKNVVGMNSSEKEAIVSPDYTWGIYLDALSSGTTVYGNIIINTVLGGIYVHGGKGNLIENNIIIDGIKNQLYATDWDKDYAENNIFLRNIIMFKNPTATLWKNDKILTSKILEKSDYNIYWNTDNPSVINTNPKITPAGSLKQWKALGFELNSLVTDPLFVDAEKGDFRLKPDSPALKLGFKPIPIERIGLNGFKKQISPD